MKNVNFYDTLEEAQRRLAGTIVTYDGEPMHAVSITNHKADGIFRIYLWPIQHNRNTFAQKGLWPSGYDNFIAGTNDQGTFLDKWMEEHKDSPLQRKMANSPSFNKFRPFPLGMINQAGKTLYLARGPERQQKQGLTSQMIDYWPVTLTPQGPQELRGANRWPGHMTTPEFYDCVKGSHPDAKTCLENLLDPDNQNQSVAFHRDFAFIRGPLDTFFLQHKTQVVGFVPYDKTPRVELAKKFAHLRETIEETKQFLDIKVRT